MRIGKKEARLAIESAQWIDRLQRLCNEAPDDIWLFVANNTLNVMVKREGQRSVRHNGSMDPTACIGTIRGIECDGGDW